jgi:muramoyltetrapeptide carboxypeptidase LdcA involved in peptidoglycan recycling
MGERSLLGQFAGVIVGRAKAWHFRRPQSENEKASYIAAQRRAILAAVRAHNPTAPIVFDVDIGHTDPQLILPYGGMIKIDGVKRRIMVRY